MMLDEHSTSVQQRTLGAILSMVGREFLVKALAFGGWIALARLLDPATFGIFAVASFALSLFVLVSEVGLGASLVRRNDVSHAELSALFTYQLAWAALLSGVALLASALLSGPLNLGDLVYVMQALAVSFLLISLRTAPSIIAQRKLAYAPIVVSDVASQVIYWVVAIAAAFAGWGLWSVVASALAFSFTNVLILYLRVGWLPTLTFDWRAVHAGAVESLMYQGQQGASLAKFAMLPLLGGLSAGGAGVGYVTWAHQIAVIPIQLTHLISRVSFPALSRLQHDLHAFTGTLRAILKWTCVVTFPACALLIGLGPQLVDYVYGPKWEPALLAFYLFTANTAINAPVGVLMPALYSLGRSTQAFRALLIMLAVTWAVGIALTVLGLGLEATAFAFLAGMVANLFIVARDLADVGGWTLFRPLLLPLASAILGAALLYAIAPATVHDVVSLVVVAALAGLLMLVANLWGEYGALLAQMKELVAKTTRTQAPAPTEERQDAGIGTP